MERVYPPSALFRFWLSLCPRLVGAALLVAGVAALGGLAAGIPTLAGGWGHQAPIDAATGIAFLVFGSVLIVLGSGRDTSVASKFRLVAVLPGVLGAAAIALGALGGASDSVAADHWPTAHVPLFSAIGMILIAGSLAFSGRRLASVGQGFAVVVGFFALLVIIGAVYGVELSEVPRGFREISLFEASCFLLLALGSACVSHDIGISAVLVSDTLGGLTARRLLPVAILVPPAMGLVRMLGERAGHFGPGFGLALFATLNASVVASLVVWNAWLVMRLDLRRRAARSASLKSESNLKDTQRVARLGGWEWMLDTGEIQLSDEAARIFSLSAVAGAVTFEQFLQVVHPSDREVVRSALKSSLEDSKPCLLDYRVTQPDGKIGFVQVRAEAGLDREGKPERLVGMVQDTSEYARLQQQLTQAQKMEGIGRLAGGVAHDFNNLLTAILGYTDLAMRSLDPSSMTYKHMSHVRQAGERSAALTQQLLAFARKTIVEPKVVNLNDTLLGMDKILRRLIGEDVEILTVAARELWSARVDASQLEQVVMNLAVNARDAMPGGGKLTLETGNVILDAEYCASRPEISPGEFVLVAVSDTGTGIPDSVKPHLFEPFFTTKERGKGTGLGLATVYGIVKQAGGHIGVYSELGRGTTFKVYLPRTQAPRETRHTTCSLESVAGGRETILLVEDEPLVRGLATEALRSQGYTVLEANNGEDALVVAANHDGEIHLLLTDVVMPRMGGKKLAEALAKSRPSTAVLYISGYTENAIVHHGVLDSHIQFLPKPFSHVALARKVRDVLDARRAPRKDKA